MNLYRKIISGNQYNALIPISKCDSLPLGRGNTDFSISEMKKWIEKFAFQTEKLAVQLKKNTLQDTCAAIHQFCYWGFQYKADDTDQLLRSPACAWASRETGIDCKSYSIVASSILTNLNIKHYLRKVAYTKMGEYTHVYVVVPKNQKTGSLADGYFMIDGTINTMAEPFCIDFKDEYMNLPHYGLNAPNQLNGTIDFNKLKDSFKSLLDKFKNIFGAIGCIGGSFYDNNRANQTNNDIINFVATKADSINKAVANKDMNALAREIQDLRGIIKATKTGIATKIGENYNYCSTKNLKGTLTMVTVINDLVCDKALMAWVNKYFRTGGTGMTKNYNCNGNEYFYGCYTDHNSTDTEELLSLTPYDQEIKAFEVNSTIQNVITTPQNFSPTDFLNSLSTVLLTMQEVRSSFGGTSTVTGEYTADLPNANQQQAGLGVFGMLMLAGAGYAAFKMFNTTTTKNKK